MIVEQQSRVHQADRQPSHPSGQRVAPPIRALASIKHTLPMIPGGVFVGIETLWLIARAVVAVLFGHAIYALREEYSESTITLHEAHELQQCIDELSSQLVRVQQDFHHRLSS